LIFALLSTGSIFGGKNFCHDLLTSPPNSELPMVNTKKNKNSQKNLDSGH
jgi:hypothetical protein